MRTHKRRDRIVRHLKRMPRPHLSGNLARGQPRHLQGPYLILKGPQLRTELCHNISSPKRQYCNNSISIFQPRIVTKQHSKDSHTIRSTTSLGIFAGLISSSLLTLFSLIGLKCPQSARQTTPATALLRRATDYIVRNTDKSIKAADVARHLGVSRSLLDLRFRKANGKTTAALIAETRLAGVKRRLRKTKQSIRGISRECGFANPNHLKNLFKRHYGMSMREYRMTNARHA